MVRGNHARWAARSGAAAALAALGVGLSVDSSPDRPLGPAPAAASATRLDHFSDCDAVAAWYFKRAMPEVTAWGLGASPYPYALTDGEMFARSASSAVAATGNGATGTNVQEAGVDESDTAKVMGDYVVAIDRRDLVITDVSRDEPSEVSRLALSHRYWTSELLISGERALVIGSRSAHMPLPYDVIAVSRMAVSGLWAGASRTSLTTVDLADPAAPEVVGEQVVDGQLSTAREHDGTVRLVTTSMPQLDFVHPTKSLNRREALAENRAIVRSADGQDWLPQRRRPQAVGARSLLDCANVNHPDGGAGLGTITVLTLSLAKPLDIDTTAVTADGSLVYASADRLYVATVAGGWGPWGSRTTDTESWRHPDTEIHAFATEGDTTAYTASGVVEGVVPDRWAFSEYGGLLRVATGRGETWRPTGSAVTVLEERDERLVTIGTVGGLGKKEQIKAVRWFGDLAVLVTFRQTDPLYTLDLSDPTSPRVIDELKVTGFSSYLHPLGDDLLLGVGQAATTSGRTTGAQVSVFDVTDPELLDRVFLGRHSWSPVENESRAFTYLPEQRIALIPTTAWRRGSSAVNVVRVGSDGSLTLLQTITVPGWDANVRSLPLSGGRVALVSAGNVLSILQLNQ